MDGVLASSLAASRSCIIQNGQDAVFVLDDLAEDGVVAVEPGAGHESNEELRAVRVGSGVGHGQKSRLVVLDVEVFVREFSSIDRNAARAIAVSEIAALRHEILNHTVEVTAFVGEFLAVVSAAKTSKVFSGLRRIVRVELFPWVRHECFGCQDLLQNESHRLTFRLWQC